MPNPCAITPLLTPIGGTRLHVLDALVHILSEVILNGEPVLFDGVIRSQTHDRHELNGQPQTYQTLV